MMKRVLAAILMTVVLASPVSASPTHKYHHCTGYHWFKGTASPNTDAVYRMGDCISRWLGVNPSDTRCRLQYESHAYPYAHRPFSRFWGPLQIGWDRTRQYTDPGDPRVYSEFEQWINDLPRKIRAEVPFHAGPFSPRASLIVGIWHARLAGWGAWTTCR